MKVLLNLLQFIRMDGRRFAWEVGGAILLAAISWGVGYFQNHSSLQACQAERAALLKESKAAQALRDSVYYLGRLKEKDQIIQQKEHENLSLREKMALDSADRLSLLEAMRAINARYQPSRR